MKLTHCSLGLQKGRARRKNQNSKHAQKKNAAFMITLCLLIFKKLVIKNFLINVDISRFNAGARAKGEDPQAKGTIAYCV
jgi:hypothetical protein